MLDKDSEEMLTVGASKLMSDNVGFKFACQFSSSQDSCDWDIFVLTEIFFLMWKK